MDSPDPADRFSAGVIGMILLGALSKYKNVLFHKKAAV